MVHKAPAHFFGFQPLKKLEIEPSTASETRSSLGTNFRIPATSSGSSNDAQWLASIAITVIGIIYQSLRHSSRMQFPLKLPSFEKC